MPAHSDVAVHGVVCERAVRGRDDDEHYGAQAQRDEEVVRRADAEGLGKGIEAAQDGVRVQHLVAAQY